MKKPTFPMNVPVFILDTAEFKNDVLGIYTRLILTQWENKDLPGDIESLAYLSKCTVEEFRPAWELMKHKFTIIEETGRLYNVKVEETRKKKDRILFFKSSAGKSGGKGKKEHIIIWPWDTVTFKEKWEIWKKYKKDSFRFSYKTELSQQGALNALKELATSEVHACELIDLAISKQWQGIYLPLGKQPVNKVIEQKKDYGKLGA